MSVDISHLGNLNSSEPLDLDTYAAAREGGSFPRKGRYILRAPDTFEGAFGQTKAGYLSAEVSPTIVGPTAEGTKLRFVKVSAKPFARGKSMVSQMGDYLKACRVSGTVSGDPQALADAVAATAGCTYEAVVDWRVYDKLTGEQIEGMENFPKDEQGNPQPWVLSSETDPETGEKKRLRANLFISRFLAAE